MNRPAWASFFWGHHPSTYRKTTGIDRSSLMSFPIVPLHGAMGGGAQGGSRPATYVFISKRAGSRQRRETDRKTAGIVRSFLMVPGAGIEPARPCGQGILSPPCLPFHHPGKIRPDVSGQDHYSSCADHVPTSVDVLITASNPRSLRSRSSGLSRNASTVLSTASAIPMVPLPDG